MAADSHSTTRVKARAPAADQITVERLILEAAQQLRDARQLLTDLDWIEGKLSYLPGDLANVRAEMARLQANAGATLQHLLAMVEPAGTA